MRKVLHLRTVSGHGGGPEKTLLYSPRYLDEYAVRLAYIRPEGDPDYNMPARAAEMGVELDDIPERSGLDPRTLFRVARVIREFKPHLLHAHDYKTNILSIPLGRWFKIPVMTTLHGYVTRGGRLELYYRLDRWALRRMAHVVAVSPDLHDLLVDLEIPEEKRSLIENAIDIEEYRRQRSRREAKEALGLDPGRLLVGAVGRLLPEKGFDILLRAVALLAEKEIDDFDLVIAGEGGQRAELTKLATGLGLGGRVRLLGYQEDLLDLYQALDVFALSSLREGLPNVLLEAMALEVPVLATRVAGVPRLIEDGKSGLLVVPGSATEIAAGLQRLCGDEALRRELGHKARAAIERGYSFAARMESMRRVYDRVLRSNGSAK